MTNGVDSWSIGVKSAMALAAYLVVQAVLVTSIFLNGKAEILQKFYDNNTTITSEVAKLSGRVDLLTQQNAAAMTELGGLPDQVRDLTNWRDNHEQITRDRRQEREADIQTLDTRMDGVEGEIREIERTVERFMDRIAPELPAQINPNTPRRK
jgi:archaellum component FlaC